MYTADDTTTKNTIVVEFPSEHRNGFWEELYIYIDSS